MMEENRNYVTFTLRRTNPEEEARKICCIYCKVTLFRTDMEASDIFEGALTKHERWLEIQCKNCKTLYRINLPYKL